MMLPLTRTIKTRFNLKFCRGLICSARVRKKSSFFITTPIFYVNDGPHLGHLYSVAMADASVRFQRLLGVTYTKFSVGTDEHGLKIQRAAQNAGLTPHQLINHNYKKFKILFENFDIAYSDFIRTTDNAHKDAVHAFFKELQLKECIYKGKYEGWYCISDESFLTNSQVKRCPVSSTEKFVSLQSGHPVEWSEEVNYMFKLSQFQDDLLYWLKNEKTVVPKQFQNELKVWISSSLKDLSISRPKSRVDWGIPLPMDEEHSIYVWVDALINYLTVAGFPNLKQWPPDSQIIGKDILRFHGIIWPALLIAAGLEPPHKLVVHSHWQCDGQKMSKSLGNVISPLDLTHLTSDGIRYSLLKLGTPNYDNSWNTQKAIECINSDLANTLGNLISRCLSKSLNPQLVFPIFDENFKPTNSILLEEIKAHIKNLPPVIKEYYTECNFYKGIDLILKLLKDTGAFLTEEQFWKLKDSSDQTRLDSILNVGLTSSIFAAIALQPIIPNTSNKILDMLNIPNDKRNFDFISNLNSSSLSGVRFNKKEVVFKRILEI